MIFHLGLSDGKKFWENNDASELYSMDIQEGEAIINNFYKHGKAFGQKCQRQYYLCKQYLLYSNIGNCKNIKGFVRLDGVYAQFQRSEHQFEIYLRNNGFQIILMTDDAIQFECWSQTLSDRCILTTFDTDFTIESNIGNGNFSSVHKCKNKQGQYFAVKVITKQQALFKSKREYEQQLLSEISTLRQLNHASIVKLHRVYESADKLYLVTELINGPQLISIGSSKFTFTAYDLKAFIYNMLLALQQIQSKNIMHRDIKPENIMLRDSKLSQPCLIDFGLAVHTNLKNNIPFPSCGSPGYSAPEIVRYEETKKMYNQQCDMFSLGVTLFAILYGYNPFKSQDKKSTIKKNAEGYFEIPGSRFPKQQNLISDMTKKYPKDRITVSQALCHPLLQTPFYHMIQLPKQILSRQQYEMSQNTNQISVHASLEIDFQFAQNSQFLTQTSPNQKERLGTINSNPMKHQTQVMLDSIDEFQLDGLEESVDTSHIDKLKLNQTTFKVQGKHNTMIHSFL